MCYLRLLKYIYIYYKTIQYALHNEDINKSASEIDVQS